MPVLATVCLEQLSFAKERMYGKSSLLAFGPFLEDDLMLTLAETFG